MPSPPRCRSNTRRSSATGFLLQLDCPTSRSSATSPIGDRPLAEFLDFVELVVAAINKALRNMPRERVRLHVLGQLRGAARPRRRRCATSCRHPLKRRRGDFLLRAPTRAMRTSSAASRTSRPDDDQVLVAGVIDTRRTSSSTRRSSPTASSGSRRRRRSAPRARRSRRRAWGFGCARRGSG